MDRDRSRRRDAVSARLTSAPERLDGTVLVGTALLALWGYLLVASSGLVVNGVHGPLAVRGFDALRFPLAAAGVGAAWGLVAGRVVGYVGTLVVSWVGVVYAYLGGGDTYGLWFWDAALVVLLAAGLYLFVSHDRFLPDEGSA